MKQEDESSSTNRPSPLMEKSFFYAGSSIVVLVSKDTKAIKIPVEGDKERILYNNPLLDRAVNDICYGKSKRKKDKFEPSQLSKSQEIRTMRKRRRKKKRRDSKINSRRSQSSDCIRSRVHYEEMNVEKSYPLENQLPVNDTSQIKGR